MMDGWQIVAVCGAAVGLAGLFALGAFRLSGRADELTQEAFGDWSNEPRLNIRGTLPNRREGTERTERPGVRIMHRTHDGGDT